MLPPSFLRSSGDLQSSPSPPPPTLLPPPLNCTKCNFCSITLPHVKYRTACTGMQCIITCTACNTEAHLQCARTNLCVCLCGSTLDLGIFPSPPASTSSAADKSSSVHSASDDQTVLYNCLDVLHVGSQSDEESLVSTQVYGSQEEATRLVNVERAGEEKDEWDFHIDLSEENSAWLTPPPDMTGDEELARELQVRRAACMWRHTHFVNKGGARFVEPPPL